MKKILITKYDINVTKRELCVIQVALEQLVKEHEILNRLDHKDFTEINKDKDFLIAKDLIRTIKNS